MNQINTLEKEIRQREQNAYRYWYIDGWAEIGVGLLFLTIALLFGINVFYPIELLTVLGLPILIFAGVFAVQRFVSAMKERVTYPRTGYVGYPPKSRQRQLRPLVLGLMFGLFFAIIFTAIRMSEAWLPLLQGATFGPIFALIGYRMSLWRYYGFALVGVLLGLLISFSPWGDPLRTAVQYGIIGGLLLLTGGVLLMRYLSQTTPPDEGGI